ncbi:MAG: pyridoxamine 5'-phosphate oxidase family protein [Gemmatimonadota bacterium]|nr:pyridoxamine 5'-phosphate oxidase family protein [Gemmatimonadota bacterium]
MTKTSEKIDELYKLIDGIEIAMFTTRRSDGALVSRPMANQKRHADADLVFVTDLESHKLDDLANDPHVNVSYYRDRTREWVSVSGAARVSRDRKRIKELYDPTWRAWFGDEGGKRDGGPDDPRIGLILVSADSAEYLVVNEPRPVVLFKVLKGMVTGNMTDIGTERHVSGGELLDGR